MTDGIHDRLLELPQGRRLSLLRALARTIRAVKRGHIHHARRELNEADGHLAVLESIEKGSEKKET